MTITKAIAAAKKLTGCVYDDAIMVSWLSEADGKLVMEFYHGDAWTPYDEKTDMDAQLVIPSPWDVCYTHYLEAMTYYSNGEYDRYTNSMKMYNRKVEEFKAWFVRAHIPLCIHKLPVSDGVTITPAETEQKFWYYLSAYALAVKHGFKGTEEEWLESLKGYIPVRGVDYWTDADQQKMDQYIAEAQANAAATAGDRAAVEELADAFPEAAEAAVNAGLAAAKASGEFDGKDGKDGANGRDGVDGYTPVKGVDYFDGKDGKDGRDGRDGVDGVDGRTPVKGLDYFDGRDGRDGTNGTDGRDGVDGVSPTAKVERVSDGAIVTVTDANGTTTAKIKDGQGGGTGGGGDMYAADYDPQGKQQDIFAYADASAAAAASAAVAGVQVPTKTSELTNDSGFLTEHQSLADYATQAWVNAQGFIKSLAGYATQAWVNAQGFLKEHQDISWKQDVIEDLAAIRSGAAKGATALQSYTETDPTVPAWAKAASKPTYTADEVGARASNWVPTAEEVGARPNTWTPTAAEVGARPSTWTPTKSDIGLGNVDNVKQYSASNPPPYPVTSVNGQTGDVTVQSGGTESTSQTVTLATSGWAQSGSRYAQTVNVTGVTASTPVVLVDVALSGTDVDADAAALEAWGIVSANNVAQGAGTLTFYALSVPSVNIPVNVGVC